MSEFTRQYGEKSVIKPYPLEMADRTVHIVETPDGMFTLEDGVPEWVKAKYVIDGLNNNDVMSAYVPTPAEDMLHTERQNEPQQIVEISEEMPERPRRKIAAVPQGSSVYERAQPERVRRRPNLAVKIGVCAAGMTVATLGVSYSVDRYTVSEVTNGTRQVGVVEHVVDVVDNWIGEKE